MLDEQANDIAAQIITTASLSANAKAGINRLLQEDYGICGQRKDLAVRQSVASSSGRFVAASRAHDRFSSLFMPPRHGVCPEKLQIGVV